MHDRQLISFITVAEKGSFHNAAPSLFVSAQALIQQMNLLEYEVGVPLLHRTNKGVELTSAGKVFYNGAVDILRREQELIADTRQRDTSVHQKLRIAICETPMLMHHIAVCFSETHPEILLEVIRGSATNWIDLLTNERVDLIEGSYAREADLFGLDFLPLVQKKRCAILHPNHPLAYKKALRLEDFAGQQIVVSKLEWLMDLRNEIISRASDAVITEQLCTTATVFECCLNGKIYLAPEIFASRFDPLVVREIDSELSWSFGLAFRREHTAVVDAFLETARSIDFLKSQFILK